MVLVAQANHFVDFSVGCEKGETRDEIAHSVALVITRFDHRRIL